MSEDERGIDEQNVITIGHIISIIKLNIRFITLLTISACFFTIIYSLSVTKLYESSSILIQVENDSSSTTNEFNNLTRNLGSFNIFGSNSELSNMDLAALQVESRDFLKHLFEEELFLKNLINESNLQMSIEDAGNPYFFEKLYRFYKDSLRISKNKLENYYSAQYISSDPLISKKMLETIISKLDKFTKEDQKKRSESKLIFYNTSLASKDNTYLVNQVLSQLIEKEYSKLSIFNEDQDYAFQIVESPYLNPFRIYPRRTTMLMLAFSISIIVSIFLSIIYFLIYRKKIF